MAKYTSTFNAKGNLNSEELTIVTEKRDGTMSIYDLQEQLNNFNGRVVTITIKEDTTIEPVEEI